MKTQLKKMTKKGFTLIELLVVITIIAVLASIAFPVYQSIIGKGDATKATQHARQIAQACWVYASDNSQKFPNSTKAASKIGRSGGTSNDILALLVPRYSPSEEIFTVDRCDVASNAGVEPDNDFTDGTDALAAGECHWAYTDDLSLGMSRIYPLVMDAFASVGTPAYTDVETSVGGRWGGQFAIVSFTDTSTKQIELDPSAFTITTNNGTVANGFSQRPWSDVLSKIVNPDGA